MRAVKVIEKEEDCYKTTLIDLSKVRSITCTYPADEKDIVGAQQDMENAIHEQSGQEIEFVFDDTQSMVFDLDKTPAKFIVFDDYGGEVIKTDDLEQLESAMLEVMSNDPYAGLEDDDKNIPVGS